MVSIDVCRNKKKRIAKSSKEDPQFSHMVLELNGRLKLIFSLNLSMGNTIL
jgi:hypothetical protein